MTYDVDEEKPKKNKKVKQAIDGRLQDMRDVLSTDQGKRVLWEIMDTAGLMSKVPSLDPNQTQRALGRREVGLEVHDWIMQAAPVQFLEMLKKRAQELENEAN